MISSFLKAFIGTVSSIGLTVSFCAAQSLFPDSVRASYDPAGIPELMNTIPVGFTFYFQDNHEEATRGFERGRVRWNSLKISSPQGEIHDGQFTFDRERVRENNHTATFNLKMGTKTVSCQLVLPYVKKIRFNLYTDSLKRGEPFYLNVEGSFSSGRIYPLDTGMVAFSRSGGGELKGQSLLVSHQDMGTHIVVVYTWLKSDPQIRDSVLVPVKIMPNPAILPTERQVVQER